MTSESPFADFRQECKKILEEALKKRFPEAEKPVLALEKPPNIEFGQLASSMCFELAKKVSVKPVELAEKLI
ncbi:MAG: hypothetical protein ACPL0C_01135, partial [Candidatus Bathyarchaeales archaeon]